MATDDEEVPRFSLRRGARFVETLREGAEAEDGDEDWLADLRHETAQGDPSLDGGDLGGDPAPEDSLDTIWAEPAHVTALIERAGAEAWAEAEVAEPDVVEAEMVKGEPPEREVVEAEVAEPQAVEAQPVEAQPVIEAVEAVVVEPRAEVVEPEVGQPEAEVAIQAVEPEPVEAEAVDVQPVEPEAIEAEVVRPEEPEAEPERLGAVVPLTAPATTAEAGHHAQPAMGAGPQERAVAGPTATAGPDWGNDGGVPAAPAVVDAVGMLEARLAALEEALARAAAACTVTRMVLGEARGATGSELHPSGSAARSEGPSSQRPVEQPPDAPSEAAQPSHIETAGEQQPASVSPLRPGRHAQSEGTALTRLVTPLRKYRSLTLRDLLRPE